MTDVRPPIDVAGTPTEPQFDVEAQFRQFEEHFRASNWGFDLRNWQRDLRTFGANEDQIDQLFSMVSEKFGIGAEKLEEAKTQLSGTEHDWAAVPTNDQNVWLRIENPAKGAGDLLLLKTVRENILNSIKMMRHYTSPQPDIGLILDGESVNDPTDPAEIAQQFIDEIEVISGSGHISFFLNYYRQSLPEEKITQIRDLIFEKIGISKEELAKIKLEAGEDYERKRKLMNGTAYGKSIIEGYQLMVIKSNSDMPPADSEGFIYRVVKNESIN